jgi:hypothetical protein
MAVVTANRDPWPSVEEWATLLPEWFVGACAPPRSQADDDRELEWLRTLSPEARAEFEENAAWELEGWLGWMEPGERTWYLAAHCERRDSLELVLAVPDEPALGALEWLVRASGGGALVLDVE